MRTFKRLSTLKAEVKFLEQTHLDTFVEKGVVLQLVSADDGAGSGIDSWVQLRATFNTACYRGPHKSEDLIEVGQRFATENEYTLYLPPNTPIKAGDRFLFLFGPCNGLTFDIVNLYDKSSEVAIQTCYIRQVTGGS